MGSTHMPRESIALASSISQSGCVTKAPCRWTVKLDFVSANPAVHVEGEAQHAALVSYLTATPEDWRTGLTTYARGDDRQDEDVPHPRDLVIDAIAEPWLCLRFHVAHDIFNFVSAILPGRPISTTRVSGSALLHAKSAFSVQRLPTSCKR